MLSILYDFFDNKARYLLRNAGVLKLLFQPKLLIKIII